MAMNPHETAPAETDPRFPSGKWLGFWKQESLRGDMELILTFAHGLLRGEGRDRIGPFTFRGRYQVSDGTCHWLKHYRRAHDVFYNGFNEGKGIWGVWEIRAEDFAFSRGGFHIWPEGMNVGDHPALSAEADVDETISESLELGEPIVAGRGTQDR
jgi:hypothetical protein